MSIEFVAAECVAPSEDDLMSVMCGRTDIILHSHFSIVFCRQG